MKKRVPVQISATMLIATKVVRGQGKKEIQDVFFSRENKRSRRRAKGGILPK
jgi:hypothetical protein